MDVDVDVDVDVDGSGCYARRCIAMHSMGECKAMQLCGDPEGNANAPPLLSSSCQPNETTRITRTMCCGVHSCMYLANCGVAIRHELTVREALWIMDCGLLHAR